MVDEVKTLYKDVLITYRESQNLWVFELGGKERSLSTLRQAKDAIDKAPKPKREAVRFKAYLLDWMLTKISVATVGAFSKDYRGKPQFWVSSGNGRSKTDAAMLVKMNDVNESVITRIRELSDEIVRLQTERATLAGTLERIDIPADDEVAL